ncbi:MULTISPECIES: glycosyltransferase [unclassified Spirosoma]|uniref:glycosyltransferase n=1 Tax=unclassified Spirosoma TaxID=2621999 RepID=UPI000964F391|nr:MULTISPECIES: glycosyltransferase [unclassified Spirosoma]MBN8821449.1 glycosyltransferase [Spirosoma sp.]OJW78230.1 MAG: teichuronic acid biosynthesis glycosyltransferase tuaH [Spirosoma sp. 48-14]
MQQFDSIVCLGQTTWEGDFQKAVVQLMTELSARHRILYVDYQYTVKDWAMGLTGRPGMPVREIIRLKDPLIKKTFTNGHEVHVWTPPLMLPVNWMLPKAHDLLVQQNVNRLVTGLRRVMRQLGMSRPLVINGLNPVFGLPMLKKLDECATIYYCFDEITIINWMRRHGSRYEPNYLRQVNAVVTTSETLRQSKSVLQPNAFCVKNGVNFELFNQAFELAQQHPPQKPIVGYLGTADNRINVEIVEYCVKTMPDVTFQFIGEVHEPRLTSSLAAYPNVLFTPSRQPAELPPLLAQMQAAMIPFVCNDHTYTIYPLKINEYLAAGLPVVSTPFSLLNDFDDVIELASSPEEFAQALRKALADTAPERVAGRVAMAKANSWAHRAEEFEAVIKQVPAAWQPEPVL